MEGSYRGPIVESEARRLARERERYRRAWSRFHRSEWVPKAMVASFGVLALAIPAAGLLAAPNLLLLVGALCAPITVLAPLAFFTIIVAVARRNLLRCPRCGELFSLKFRWRDLYIGTGGDQCRHCDLPRGYLPTAEDLDEDELTPSRLG